MMKAAAKGRIYAAGESILYLISTNSAQNLLQIKNPPAIRVNDRLVIILKAKQLLKVESTQLRRVFFT
jgi:hypothetical protein